MNTYAVVMQSGSMSSAAQWVVIGLSMTSLLCAWIVSGKEQMSPTAARFMGALAVALVLATLAVTPTYAAVLMDCSWWGCFLDSILW